jgi:hypothetical protein
MLSGSDIISWFEKLKLPAPDIIRYPDLERINPEELLSNNCKFLLYEQFERVGHWCVFYYSPPDECFIFFDPYSAKPDDELKYTYHKDMTLTKILIDHEEDTSEIDYNEYRYQADNTSTCGRIASIRYLMSYCGYTIQQFKEMFYDNKSLEERDLNCDVMYEVLDEIANRETL